MASPIELKGPELSLLISAARFIQVQHLDFEVLTAEANAYADADANADATNKSNLSTKNVRDRWARLLRKIGGGRKVVAVEADIVPRSVSKATPKGKKAGKRGKKVVAVDEDGEDEEVEEVTKNEDEKRGEEAGTADDDEGGEEKVETVIKEAEESEGAVETKPPKPKAKRVKAGF